MLSQEHFYKKSIPQTLLQHPSATTAPSPAQDVCSCSRQAQVHHRRYTLVCGESGACGDDCQSNMFAALSRNEL